jgi:hypothetical protein
VGVGEGMQRVTAAGCTCVHSVPDLTLGPSACKSLRYAVALVFLGCWAVHENVSNTRPYEGYKERILTLSMSA